MDIDFVNLRSETYSDTTSRIPEMEFGTPLQDAERRDFTCNALFYNLHTASVEDWCGTGIKDLHEGVLSTPLTPEVTLMDDPLRVLRAVRFSARLSFRMDSALQAAASSASVQTALVEKVKRERVGKELDGMLGAAGKAPLEAVKLLLALGLEDSVFKVPAEASAASGVPTRSYIEHLDLVMGDAWPQGPVIALHERRILLLAGCAAKWAKSSIPGKKKSTNTVFALIRDGLKLRLKDSEDAVMMLGLCDALKELSIQLDSIKRSALGLFVRTSKGLWRVALRLACAVELAEGCDEERDSVVQRYGALEEMVGQLGLARAWELEPLMDGKVLIERVRLPKGPVVGMVKQEQIRWQLDHPEGGAEECVEYLIRWWEDLSAALNDVKMRLVRRCV
eukprot:TRINITY_DN6848_c0_g2_i2.p1 TRINITY_DN6848_c0_g2~~TRINITY_DN6848_c0_g2_i2.p1  ORF type:complete len:393 (-),score=80.89 TRINITY_DN6848_c0_g2_i2:184-1362(-)